MCSESTKEAVLATICRDLGSWTCDRLMSVTGLDTCEIFDALQILISEGKINISVTPLPEATPGYIARNEYLYFNFINLLDRYITQERRIGFYASKLFITPKYLSWAVKQTSGKSANFWINQRLLDIIKLELGSTTKSLKEIACGLNFSNNSSFGKYFKAHTGLSPSDYRKTLGS